MRHLKLPDGSLVHPGQVERFDITGVGPGYRLRLVLRGHNAGLVVASGLPHATAEELKRQYDAELGAMAGEIAAYQEGWAVGAGSGLYDGTAFSMIDDPMEMDPRITSSTSAVRFSVERRLFFRGYCVRRIEMFARSLGGVETRNTIVRQGLSKASAEELRQRCEDTLAAYYAGVTGYAEGFYAGVRYDFAGIGASEQRIWWAGVDAVLDALKYRRAALAESGGTDEATALADGVIARFNGARRRDGGA